MIVKKEKILNVYIFLNTAFIFTNYIFNIQGPFIIFLTTLLLLLLTSKSEINIDISEIIFINLGIVFLLASLISTEKNDALKYSIPFFCLIINMLICKEISLNLVIIK